MDKPTQEQIKELWEWCGFYQEGGSSYMDSTPYKVWKHSSNIIHDFSYGNRPNVPIDLNNLFKYAVPNDFAVEFTPQPLYGTIQCILSSSSVLHGEDMLSCGRVWRMKGKGIADKDDPALALFWAIWEVIKK